MRCAIYTRKSADERPDVRLSTIDNQRDLCEKYVASQAGDGWQALEERYDDLGWSGSTMERPALKRLIADIENGLVDAIVVYKIDRLSRSLRDFLGLVDALEKRQVTFVSVTQAFNTSSSMGRLTINVLLSFAQFERELIGERSRDWKAGARAKGLWTSGPPPFGYIVRDLKLEPHPEHAAVVRRVYRQFLKTKSYAPIADDLNASGLRNRLGFEIDGRMVKAMLTSRVYRGDLTFRRNPIPGFHRPIVSEALWQQVQTIIAQIPRYGGRPKRKIASIRYL